MPCVCACVRACVRACGCGFWGEQDASFGGMEGLGNEGVEVAVHEGKIWLNLPVQSCLVFRQL